MAQEGFLNTIDDARIAYSYIDAYTDKAVILLHQFRRDHRSYDEFAKELSLAGISSIAIDLRGHGESSGKYPEFSDSDFVSMKNDCLAAKKFLSEKNKRSIFIIGASIGANTAINFAAENPEVKGIILLSPGLTYHWIDVEKTASAVRCRALIYVSQDDDYSFASSGKIYDLIESEKSKKIFSGSAHGTDMFLGTDMNRDIIKWIGKAG